MLPKPALAQARPEMASMSLVLSGHLPPPTLPAPIRAPTPDLTQIPVPTPSQYAVVHMLTIPCSRLRCHAATTAPETIAALGPLVTISQLSKPQCGFLPPHPPQPQHQGFPQNVIATPLCF